MTRLKTRELAPAIFEAAAAGEAVEAEALVDQGHARIRSKMMFIAPFTFAMLESLQEW